MSNHKLSVFSFDRKTIFISLFMVVEVAAIIGLLLLWIRLDISIKGFNSSFLLAMIGGSLYFGLGLIYDKLERRFFEYAYPKR